MPCESSSFSWLNFGSLKLSDFCGIMPFSLPYFVQWKEHLNPFRSLNVECSTIMFSTYPETADKRFPNFMFWWLELRNCSFFQFCKLQNCSDLYVLSSLLSDGATSFLISAFPNAPNNNQLILVMDCFETFCPRPWPFIIYQLPSERS